MTFPSDIPAPAQERHAIDREFSGGRRVTISGIYTDLAHAVRDLALFERMGYIVSIRSWEIKA